MQEEKGGAPETGEAALDSETEAVMKPQDTNFCQDLEKGMLSDLEKMDATALRYRIAQLVAEMQERTKWESLRWHEVVVVVVFFTTMFLRFHSFTFFF